MIVSSDGDYTEVLLQWDPKLDLPDIANGVTQIHSVGDSPQLIEIADSKIKLGKSASESVIKGDIYREAEDKLLDTLSSLLTAAGSSLNAAGTDPVMIVVAKAAAASLNSAGTSLNLAKQAIDTFKANAAQYKSTLVKTE